MELTGLQIRNMQMLEDLEKTIKEFEIKRIENDLLITDKYDDLYKVYSYIHIQHPLYKLFNSYKPLSILSLVL